MNQRIAKLLTTLTIVLLPWSAQSAEVDVKRLAGTKWTKIESDHFVVVTDSKVFRAKAMVAELERFRHFMFSQFDELLTETEDKMPLVLVEGPRTYSALGIPRGYAGVFAQSKEEAAILAYVRGFSRGSADKPNWGRTVVLHELVHHLIRQSPFEAATAPWFDEGLAEYFSTYLEGDEGVVVGATEVVLARIHSMLGIDSEDARIEPEHISSESLFKADKAALTIVNSSSQERESYLNRFYGRSLAVVHYLSASPQGRQQLLEYLHRAADGAGVDEAFEETFGGSFTAFDQDVARYYQSGDVEPRRFPVEHSAHERTDITITASRLRRRYALEFIIPKISAFPESFLGEGNRDKMYAGVEALYPDFFQS